MNENRQHSQSAAREGALEIPPWLLNRQLAFNEIPPPPPSPPEGHLLAQLREAHTILSRLSVTLDQKLPSNVYMAMTYLHVEIAVRTSKEVPHAPSA